MARLVIGSLDDSIRPRAQVETQALLPQSSEKLAPPFEGPPGGGPFAIIDPTGPGRNPGFVAAVLREAFTIWPGFDPGLALGPCSQLCH